MLLCSFLVDGHTGLCRVTTADLLCLPDEVLEEIALVLREKKDLSFLDNFSQITNELLAFWRELL